MLLLMGLALFNPTTAANDSDLEDPTQSVLTDQYQQFFAQFDANRDGVIDGSESKKFFKRTDRNRDALLSSVELKRTLYENILNICRASREAVLAKKLNKSK